MIVCPVCLTVKVRSTLISCWCRRLNAWLTGDAIRARTALAELEWSFAPRRNGEGSIGQGLDGSLFQMGVVIRWVPEDERESLVDSAILLAREHDLSEAVLAS